MSRRFKMYSLLPWLTALTIFPGIDGCPNPLQATGCVGYRSTTAEFSTDVTHDAVNGLRFEATWDYAGTAWVGVPDPILDAIEPWVPWLKVDEPGG